VHGGLVGDRADLAKQLREVRGRGDLVVDGGELAPDRGGVALGLAERRDLRGELLALLGGLVEELLLALHRGHLRHHERNEDHDREDREASGHHERLTLAESLTELVHLEPPPRFESAAFVRSTELLNVHTGLDPIAVFWADDIHAFTQPGSRWSRIRNEDSVGVSSASPSKVIDPT